MASSPNRLLRVLAGLSVGRENREDALTAFDELFAQKYEEEGPLKAHLWSVGQAIRFVPWGPLAKIAQVTYVILKIGAFLLKNVP